MAAPIVAGAMALLLQDEPNLTPDQVKFRLKATANKTWLGYNPVKAGAGYLDIYAAVHADTTASANIGQVPSQLLWTGDKPGGLEQRDVELRDVELGHVEQRDVELRHVELGHVEQRLLGAAMNTLKKARSILKAQKARRPAAERKPIPVPWMEALQQAARQANYAQRQRMNTVMWNQPALSSVTAH